MLSFMYSIPMEMPFGLGRDFPEKLVTPRPFELLKELEVVVAVDEAPKNAEKHDFVLAPDGVPHVFVGSDMWAEKTGQETHELNLSAFRWIKDLFAMLVGEKERPESRRLGACWYYTASEASFDEDSESVELESGEEEDLGKAVTGTLLGVLGGPALRADEEDDEDEDADFVPQSVSVSESFESNSEAGVEPMEESSPEFKVPGEPYRPEEDEEDEEEDGEDDDEDDFDSEANEARMQELEEAEEEIRSSILESVAVLHCYMPSPMSHMSWFKRMLIKMQPGADPIWFPYGIPPVQQILNSVVAIEGDGSKKLTPEEDSASDFLRELLKPFMDMQQGQAD